MATTRTITKNKSVSHLVTSGSYDGGGLAETGDKLTTMAIVLDKSIQRTFSTTLHAPAESLSRCSGSPVLWHTRSLRSGYAPPPPSPASSAKPSATQDIISPSANIEAERSPCLDPKKFIQAIKPGAYQVAHSYIPSTPTLTYSTGVSRGFAQRVLCNQIRLGPK
jgi:hypothetical protein